MVLKLNNFEKIYIYGVFKNDMEKAMLQLSTSYFNKLTSNE